ncbi:hypothetical protein N431DRAFT_435551 [Stipitochalara longipes BDJ]|nr:hypothetical protein N431DRAFT_435551 [Stipitochalara longipes BDJ]
MTSTLANRKEYTPPGNLKDPDFWSSLKIEDPVERLLSFTKFYHSCRWFTRVWTVQEVILAQHTRMFCGETELSLQNTQDLLSVFDTLGWTRELLGCFNSEIGPIISLQRRFFAELTALRHLGATVHQPTLTYNEEGRNRWKAGAERCIILSKILFSCRSHFCLDSRDKVYAALAMIKDSDSHNPIAERITADYTIPVETVFTEVTTLILENSKYLDIISDTRHQDPQRDQGTGFHFPSWAHDLSVRFVASSLVLTDPSFSAALCEAPEFPPFRVNGRIIECHGASLDTVTEVQATGLELLMLQNEHSIIDFVQLYMSLKPRIQGVSRMEVLWRSLTFDPRSRVNDHSLAPSFVAWFQVQLATMLEQARDNGDEAVAEAASIIDGMLAIGSPEEIALVQKMLSDDLPYLLRIEFDQKLDPEQATASETLRDYYHRPALFENELPDALELRRLCTTTKGFLAVCVDTVQKNDQVWLLTDAHTPVILRPTDVPGSFRIIGDCYIYGFMHGEMLDEKWGVKQNIGPIKII